MGAGVTAALRRDGVGTGARRRFMLAARGAVSYWPEPTVRVRATFIVGVDAAVAFRRNGVGNGAKSRGVLADAAAREGQRHCVCGVAAVPLQW